jgi:hypothetical protein
MGQPLREAFSAAFPTSSISPSTASSSPHTNPLITPELPFKKNVQISLGTDNCSAYGPFSLFITCTNKSIALLSINTNKYARTKDAGETGRE